MPQAQTYQSEFTGLQMDERFRAVATLAEALTAVVAQKYVKPASGIPSTDMDADVQAALAKANTAVQSLADYYTKSEVDQLLAAINGMEYVDVAALPTASASTLGKIYLVGPDGSGYYAYYYTSYDGSAYSWVGPLGTTQISLANYATKAELSQLDQEINGLSSEEEQSPTYKPCRWVAKDGSMSALDSGTTYSYCDPLPIAGLTGIKVKAVLNSPSAGGIYFLNYNGVPTSSVQAASRVVAGYYGTSSTAGNVNEEITFTKEQLDTIRQLGGAYIYVGVYQAGAKEMVFITEEEGLVDRVETLEQAAESIPLHTQEIAKLQETDIRLDREIGHPFCLPGYYSNTGVYTENSTFRCTHLIPLEGVTNILAIYTAYAGSTTNVVYFDESGNFLNYAVWGQRLRQEITTSDFPAGAKYAAFSTFASFLPQAQIIVNDVYSLVGRVHQLISWADRVGVCYGDSITAQGNNGVDGYVGILKREIKFSALYGRGVGGQSYIWNNGGWYSEVGTNGAYLDRYLYDSEGNKTTQLISADATAEQIGYIESALDKEIEVHRGCFCSWDRITAMIPSTIKDSVDLIILMGGTNDFSSDHALGTGFPEWSAANVADTDWVADTDYYNGGDYDLSTFSGGLMSTIMKMTIWCPNAVIVVASPWGNFDTSSNAQTENGNGDTIYDFSDREIELAAYLGCPSINISSEAGVNSFNAATYFADDYHPNALGARLIAKAIIGGLRRIPSRLV